MKSVLSFARSLIYFAIISTSSNYLMGQTENEMNCELRKYKWNEDVTIAVAIAI